MYWLYNRTGKPWLLELAKRMYARSADWAKGIASLNGVDISHGFRTPAIYYQQSHDATLLEAVRRNHKTIYDRYGQMPGGMFAADENCREGYTGPQQGAHTCAVVELMHSYETRG